MTAGPGLSGRITLAAVLLTAGTGVMDVASFTRLGGVFTSVITGNLVLFGLAAVRASTLLAEHAALSLGGYVVGVAASARIIAMAPGRDQAARDQAARDQAARDQAARAGQPEGEMWPPMVTAALGVEFALLAAFSAGWELSGARPSGAGQYALLAVTATAMGVQAAAVRGLGKADFSTTYLTGQLTGLIAALVTPGKRRWAGWRQPGPLLALAAGALVSGGLIATAPAAVPVIVLAPLGTVLALYAAARRAGEAG